MVGQPGTARHGSLTDGEGGKRGQMCVLARGKPPGSGQSLPNKQSHSDERLIAIVFFCFPKAEPLFPRARLQCGTGWLCLVAVRPLSSRWSRLTEAQSQEYLCSRQPPTHERTAGCRRLNPPPPRPTQGQRVRAQQRVSLPPRLLTREGMKSGYAPPYVLSCQIPFQIGFCCPFHPWAGRRPLSAAGSPTSPTRAPPRAAVPGETRLPVPASAFPKPLWFHTKTFPGCCVQPG